MGGSDFSDQNARDGNIGGLFLKKSRITHFHPYTCCYKYLKGVRFCNCSAKEMGGSDFSDQNARDGNIGGLLLKKSRITHFHPY